MIKTLQKIIGYFVLFIPILSGTALAQLGPGEEKRLEASWRRAMTLGLTGKEQVDAETHIQVHWKTPEHQVGNPSVIQRQKGSFFQERLTRDAYSEIPHYSGEFLARWVRAGVDFEIYCRPVSKDHLETLHIDSSFLRVGTCQFTDRSGNRSWSLEEAYHALGKPQFLNPNGLMVVHPLPNDKDKPVRGFKRSAGLECLDGNGRPIACLEFLKSLNQPVSPDCTK